MSSLPPPPAVPGDSLPDAPLSVPGVALWSDSDSARPPGPDLSGLVATPAEVGAPTIGHIGRYALKYQLGAGGLGTVFAAHDPLLSRLIAVKTLNVEIKAEEQAAFNAHFIHEARAAGGLSHPHIVTVFDAGISDNRAYIAMELLKGRDLRQLRQEGWRATPAQAALICRRVADALAFAHSKGVIHRDIKPANIFMVGRTQPRVLDFGIARIAHQRDSGDAMNGAGSPFYMSPEQVRREPGDRRSDVFSLGVVLYELLTDSKPFNGSSLKEITGAVLDHEPPLASKVDKNVPKALAEIAARAMAKDPEQRFRSARSFARQLRQWLDDNPVAPEGDAGLPLPIAPAARRRTAAVAIAGLSVLVAGLAAALWWQTSATTERPAVAVAAAPSRVIAPAPRPVALVAVPAPMASASTTALPTVGATSSAASATTPMSATPIATSPVAAVPPAASAAAIAGASEAGKPLPMPSVPPTGAQNAAARESLLLASIVPTPAPNATPAKTVAVGASPARETPKERRAREARERVAKAQDARTAPPAAVATGTVRIAISPWGQVEVDGASSGVAPPLTELNLSEGLHRIVVRNGDFTPFVATVNVVAGQPTTVRHRFGS